MFSVIYSATEAPILNVLLRKIRPSCCEKIFCITLVVIYSCIGIGGGGYPAMRIIGYRMREDNMEWYTP